MRTLFEALEIGATDAWSLFLSLDHNEDYQIEPEEPPGRGLGPTTAENEVFGGLPAVAWHCEVHRPLLIAQAGRQDAVAARGAGDLNARACVEFEGGRRSRRVLFLPFTSVRIKEEKRHKRRLFRNVWVQAVATSRFHCEDGALANMTRCSQTALVPCRAACGWQGELSKRPWRSGLVPRSEMPRGPR